MMKGHQGGSMNTMTECGAGRVSWHVRIEPPSPEGLLLRMLPRRRVVSPQRIGTTQRLAGRDAAMLDNGQLLLPGVADPYRWCFSTGD